MVILLAAAQCDPDSASHDRATCSTGVVSEVTCASVYIHFGTEALLHLNVRLLAKMLMTHGDIRTLICVHCAAGTA